MLILIGELNGQKIQIPVTADTGAGAPVGSYLYLEKKSDPSGYLFCDGTRFDPTKYPALYQYLGTDKLPDWREFSAVGAEQNTTNVYDAQTNPNGIIHDHDVYTEGQAKDDQLQNHRHLTAYQAGDTAEINTGVTYGDNAYNTGYVDNIRANGRAGTTTHGKRKAVFIYIKATSGLTENQQENVLNTINQNLSYSTEEHPTGRKSSDGKNTYQRTFVYNNISMTTGTAVIIQNAFPISSVNIEKLEGTALSTDGNNVLSVPNFYIATNNDLGAIQNIASTSYNIKVNVEYTKTTDN